MTVRLHLACGSDYREGYINVDLYSENADRVDAKFDVRSVPYPDNSVDEILALHVIEHFDFHEGNRVLQEWYRVLKPGGKLIVETPDFLETCRAFVVGPEPRRWELYNHFFAAPWIDGQTHKFLFTEDQLTIQLGWAKFNTIKRIWPLSKYLTNDNSHLLLAMEAIK
jgi:predicted SAM-dependent methyltransferase